MTRHRVVALWSLLMTLALASSRRAQTRAALVSAVSRKTHSGTDFEHRAPAHRQQRHRVPQFRQCLRGIKVVLSFDIPVDAGTATSLRRGSGERRAHLLRNTMTVLLKDVQNQNETTVAISNVTSAADPPPARPSRCVLSWAM